MPQLKYGKRFDRFSTLTEAKIYAALYKDAGMQDRVEARLLNEHERVILRPDGLPEVIYHETTLSDCKAGVFYYGEKSLYHDARKILKNGGFSLSKRLMGRDKAKRLLKVFIKMDHWTAEDVWDVFAALSINSDLLNKIQLIKEVHRFTGESIKEAKGFVDKYLDKPHLSRDPLIDCEKGDCYEKLDNHRCYA